MRLSSMSKMAALVCAFLIASPASALAGTDGRIFLDKRKGDLNHIYSVRPDGTSLKRLTPRRTYDYAPLISPDGSKVAFIRYDRDSGEELMVMRADGRKTRELSADLFVSSFAWAPDSSRLVFTSYDSLGDEDLWLVSTKDRVPEPLADDAVLDEKWASWSPDGEEIVFVKGNDLVVMDVSTGAQRVLVIDADAYWVPAWSPNGELIAFASSRDDPYQEPEFDGPYTSEIYVVPAEGGDVTNVSRLERSTDGAPQWTPDSKRIVFRAGYDDDIAAGRRYDSDIYIVGANGTGRMNLTDNRGIDEEAPVISPSGRWIAFVRFGKPTGTSKISVDGSKERTILRPDGFPHRPGSWGPGR